MNYKFAVEDKVFKKVGYCFVGEVRAAFTTRQGEIRYAVELVADKVGGNGDRMIHIFNQDQLELV